MRKMLIGCSDCEGKFLTEEAFKRHRCEDYPA